MKKILNSILLSMLMCMVSVNAFAYDIEVENNEGVTIYYNYINDGGELEVTYGNDFPDFYSNHYSGAVTIPEEVMFMEKIIKVTSIGFGAFLGCSELSSVTIPNSVTKIGEMAFNNCSGLTSVSIPNSVTSIEQDAFKSCSGLTSVSIPNSVTSIEYGTFSYCTGLISVDIPNSVTRIGDFAFSGCTNLTSVNIPNSVTSIGSGAFGNCYHFTSLIIPNSVTTIRGMAFYGVDLSVVISNIENPSKIEGKVSSNRTFSSYTFQNATLYVPLGTKEKYMATDGWKDFAHIEEDKSSGISGASAPSVLIQSNDGILSITGVNEGTPIIIYNTAGQILASTKASSETTTVGTRLKNGEIGIVKIGDKAVKVLMK